MLNGSIVFPSSPDATFRGGHRRHRHGGILYGLVIGDDKRNPLIVERTITGEGTTGAGATEAVSTGAGADAESCGGADGDCAIGVRNGRRILRRNRRRLAEASPGHRPAR